MISVAKDEGEFCMCVGQGFDFLEMIYFRAEDQFLDEKVTNRSRIITKNKYNSILLFYYRTILLLYYFTIVLF